MSQSQKINDSWVSDEHKRRIQMLNDSIESIELTPRETETLDHLKNGLMYKHIADRMNVSPNTVKVFIASIYKKLKVNTRFEAIKAVAKLRPEPDTEPSPPPCSECDEPGTVTMPDGKKMCPRHAIQELQNNPRYQ